MSDEMEMDHPILPLWKAHGYRQSFSSSVELSPFEPTPLRRARDDEKKPISVLLFNITRSTSKISFALIATHFIAISFA